MEKEIIVIGDKVLVEPQTHEEMTASGIYIPDAAKEKEKVQAGKIVKTGPGYPVPDPSLLNQEPWSGKTSPEKYFPLQAQVGDWCVFLREQAVEVTLDHKKYLVIPHSAILLLTRSFPGDRASEL